MYIPIYICSYTHLCLYTYEYMGVHICSYIQVSLYIYLLMYMYVTIHEYKYIHKNTTCSCCGTSQRFGVGLSDWVCLVSPCECLTTEFPWYVHHWNQHCLVFERGVFCKLGFEIFPIDDEFVGNVKHFAQHCTCLWPLSQ